MADDCLHGFSQLLHVPVKRPLSLLAEQFRATINLQQSQGQRDALRTRALRFMEKTIDIGAPSKQTGFFIGHGKGSFAFKTARQMLANGFYPDTWAMIGN